MADLIPLTQAAREFNVHRATLYRYIQAGKLTAYERGIGRGTYLDRKELRKLSQLRPVSTEEKP